MPESFKTEETVLVLEKQAGEESRANNKGGERVCVKYCVLNRVYSEPYFSEKQNHHRV